ncbi:SDR family oxidoreductase [Poriferisphaera sp. WC338]|uniref:SDR family oxidoreductase n=1 Tax=Poriferisphaera sp. WC338 TaxID=3425129 RepID=UPI003D81C12A
MQHAKDRFSLEGKTAIVTGGSGLYGQQITRGLAEAGTRTIIASRNLAHISQFADELNADGFCAHAHQLDQADPDSIRALFEWSTNHIGKIDILVNNAVSRPMKDWDDDLSKFQDSIQTNLTGILEMTRVFGNHMAANKQGSIINIGSIQGMVGPDYSLYEGLNWNLPPDYYIHKGGMIQLTRFAAAKLGPNNVRANTISPGGFYTGQNQTFVDRYNKRTFLGRMANQEDLMGAIIFLASDASSYITGSNLVVDGGYTA